jgi:hypothetical protein
MQDESLSAGSVNAFPAVFLLKALMRLMNFGT